MHQSLKSLIRSVQCVCLYSTRCCCILWTAGCCPPTAPMSGRWVSSLWPGVLAASSWPSAATMKKYEDSPMADGMIFKIQLTMYLCICNNVCPPVRCASSIISRGRKSHSLSTQQPSTAQKPWVHFLSLWRLWRVHSFVDLLCALLGRV